MMDKRHEMIARRAVACRAWRWEAGMLGWSAPSAEPDVRYLGEGLWWDVEDEEVLVDEPDDPLPDFSDAATLGCLIALVREEYLDGWLSASGVEDYGWIVNRSLAPCSSEAEAWVAALERAPQ